jgi:hypothetical protein
MVDYVGKVVGSGNISFQKGLDSYGKRKRAHELEPNYSKEHRKHLFFITL